MGRIIDLSWNIVENMPVFPGDPGVSIAKYADYVNTGYCVSQVSIGTHAGTHIDAPLHKCKKGKSVDSLPIENFFGKAFLADLTYLKPEENIKLDDIKQHYMDIKKCSIIIFITNWSERYGMPDFFSRFPGISYEAAEWLANQDIKLIGLDSPSVNAREHAKIHELFFNRNIMIVESLCNLKSIKNKYVQFFAVPLKLKGLDGSPVRAFAIED